MSSAHPCDPAARLDGIALSEIVRISEAARKLRAQGHDVISLGTGEPDFPTPPHVIEAAHAAAKAGETRYTPTAGTPRLRAAIAAAAARECGFSPDTGEVIVSTGAKQVIFNALMATLDPGDEVIIAAPCWSSYPDMVRTCGGVPVLVPTSAAEGFRLRAEPVRAALGQRSRWLLLNSPGNPSGAVLGEAELQALAALVRETPQLGVISDEIYQHIAYAPFVSFRAAAPDLAARTLVVNGVSKAYAMTGWRIGWGIGPAGLIRAMTTVQGQVTSGAPSVSQAAALAALEGPQDLLAERCEGFRARRDLVVDALNATGRLHCPRPDGAFYVFANCSGCFGLTSAGGHVIADDGDFCDALLAESGVALVPGRAFGAPGHFRLSYAYDSESLRLACARIADFCAGLH